MSCLCIVSSLQLYREFERAQATHSAIPMKQIMTRRLSATVQNFQEDGQLELQ